MIDHGILNITRSAFICSEFFYTSKLTHFENSTFKIVFKPNNQTLCQSVLIKVRVKATKWKKKQAKQYVHPLHETLLMRQFMRSKKGNAQLYLKQLRFI